MSVQRERIILIRPFAYISLFDWEDITVTVHVSKDKTVEAKRLFWRIYWVGML